MGIISYAQNFEDVILWRALGHVPAGTYLDIGAHHPDIDSVSKAFYDHGWRGVHVEPGPAVAQLLREKRPGDVVVQAMVSDEPGIRAFYETPGGGLSTADQEIAAFHQEHGNAPVSATTVVSVTLDDVLEQVPGDEIHWLKIDVEGFERQVLQSWRTSGRRPWIVVVEATYPKTRTATYGQWEDLVLSKGYEFAYDDGLNRFYVSEQHRDLREHLIHPPNVFDEFQINPSGSSVFSQDMKAFLEGEVFSREDRIGGLERELAQARTALAAALGDHAQHKATHEQLHVHWRDAMARADSLVERLLDREAEIADQKRRLEQLTRDNGSLTYEVDRLSVGVARGRFLPWPLRALPGMTSGHVTVLERLQSLPEDDFLRLAFRIILGREADEAGSAHYRVKIAHGRSRNWVLADLAGSEEARRRESGDDLADLSDDAFVDAAYLRMLERSPDPVGKQHYVARLGSGLSRPQLLRELRNSEEGRQRHGGLWPAIDDMARRRQSFLGWRAWAPSSRRRSVGRVSYSEISDVLGQWDDLGKQNRQGAVCTDHGEGAREEIYQRSVRQMQDKIGLLVAAIEGIEARR